MHPQKEVLSQIVFLSITFDPENDIKQSIMYDLISNQDHMIEKIIEIY